MLTAALALLVAPGPGAVRHPDDPPIRLSLSDESYVPGERARVHVKLAESGYLLVLWAGPDGRIRVLYPIDPGDTAIVPGGKQFEVRSRGDRDAFMVGATEGTGTVLAARSDAPFQFSDFTRGTHWDYRALTADSAGDDPEAMLVALVDQMTVGHYDYDVESYAVGSRPIGRHYSGWLGPRWYGYYNRCYFDCWPYYGPYYGPRFGFRLSIGLGRGRRWGRRY